MWVVMGGVKWEECGGKCSGERSIIGDERVMEWEERILRG